MNDAAKIQRTSSEDDKQVKQRLRDTISSYGEFNFEDDSWYYSKLHQNSAPRGCFSITFYKVPAKYKNVVKHFALLEPYKPESTCKKVLKIADFLHMLITKFKGIPLQEVTYRHVTAFEQMLMESNQASGSKHYAYACISDFFKRIVDLRESPRELPVKRVNPFKDSRRFAEEKYISESATKKLDTLFKDVQADIPISYRFVYWMLRSYPNRMNEVLSMRPDCLYEYNNLYFIEVPMYKSSGPTGRPEMKRIPVAYIDHGKYLIDLLKAYQKNRKYLLSTGSTWHVAQNPDLLCIAETGRFVMGDEGIKFVQHKDHVANMSSADFNKMLAELSSLLDLRDDNGKSVKVRSHYFRHNSITDRLYVPDYTQEQIMKLTGHKNERMVQNYTHQKKSIHKRIAEENDNGPVTMERVIKFNQATIKFFGKSENCYGLSEVKSDKGLGLCSDIDNCKRDGTPIRFCCYFCEWFVPNPQYLKAYEDELKYWEDKIVSVESSLYSGKLTVEQATQVRDKLKSIVNSTKKKI